MVRAMLCATHDRTSDAETSRRTRVDSDWKAAMGVDDWFEGIGATTFSLMRARMVAHDADGALFQKTLERAVETGIFKQPLTAVIDSSPVHGAGAVASTYELVRKMMGRLARALGDHLDAGLAAKVAAAGGGQAGHRLAGPRGPQRPPGRAAGTGGHACWAAPPPIRSWRLTPKWPRRPGCCPRWCSKT